MIQTILRLVRQKGAGGPHHEDSPPDPRAPHPAPRLLPEPRKGAQRAGVVLELQAGLANIVLYTEVRGDLERLLELDERGAKVRVLEERDAAREVRAPLLLGLRRSRDWTALRPRALEREHPARSRNHSQRAVHARAGDADFGRSVAVEVGDRGSASAAVEPHRRERSDRARGRSVRAKQRDAPVVHDHDFGP